MRRTYRVTSFEGTRLSRDTVLRRGSILQLGGDDGWLRIYPGGKWNVFPPCNGFDFVGVAKDRGKNRPEIWYGIVIVDGGLQGTLWPQNPCGNAVPSAIATWEAEEEDIEPWEAEEEDTEP